MAKEPYQTKSNTHVKNMDDKNEFETTDVAEMPHMGTSSRKANSDEKENNSLENNHSQAREQPKEFRQDAIAWLAGMLFIIALLGAMFGLGHYREWDANSGYSHNESDSSKDRFQPEPFDPEPGQPGRSDPAADTRWYYWQLPPDKTNALTRLFVWLSYIGHQLTIWATIYYAQKKKTNREFYGPKYSSKIYGIQWVPLLLNIFFHVLHLAQTHITYDALAQDVSEASSQGAVIMLLVLVLLMEYRDRGLAFGWPTAQHKDKFSRKLRLSQGPVNLVRKYHGYAFSWGAIYTFWYHPMENTWGHALGFMHTWMIMLQGSLMYTNVHLNRLWRLNLEAWVVIHGTVVAMQTGGPDMNGTLLWPMFCFGFLWMLTMTQLFGFSFWKRIPWWTRVIPFLAYLGVCVWCYSWIPDRDGNYYIRLPQEIIRIPGIQYSSVLYAWLLLEIFIRVEKKIYAKMSESEKNAPLSPGWETFYILCFMLVYVCIVLLSYLLQQLDAKQDLFTLMISLIFVFLFGVCLSFMFLKAVFKPKSFKVSPAAADGETVKSSNPNGILGKVNNDDVDGENNKGFEDIGL